MYHILFTRDLYQKLMNTNYLRKSLLKCNSTVDLCWGLQTCTCDSSTTYGLVITLMNDHLI